jgi:hypothetical protein
MKNCSVRIVELAKVSSADLGHRLSAPEHVQLRGRNGMAGIGYFFFVGADGAGGVLAG